MNVNTSLYIKVLDREDPILKDRSWSIFSYTTDKVQRIPIPDDVMLCDICNKPIKTDTINILCQDGGIEIGEVEHGTICETCRLAFHPNAPIHQPQRVEYWLIVDRKPLWIGPTLEELQVFKREHIEGAPPTLMILERPLCPRCNIVPDTETNICPLCEEDVGETKGIDL